MPPLQCLLCDTIRYTLFSYVLSNRKSLDFCWIDPPSPHTIEVESPKICGPPPPHESIWTTRGYTTAESSGNYRRMISTSPIFCTHAAKGGTVLHSRVAPNETLLASWDRVTDDSTVCITIFKTRLRLGSLLRRHVCPSYVDQVL